MNDLEVCWWPVDKPIPYSRNSRKIPGHVIREAHIRALEVDAFESATILHFADGSTQEIRGARYFLLDLFAGACRGDLNSAREAQIAIDPRVRSRERWLRNFEQNAVR